MVGRASNESWNAYFFEIVPDVNMVKNYKGIQIRLCFRILYYFLSSHI